MMAYDKHTKHKQKSIKYLWRNYIYKISNMKYEQTKKIWGFEKSYCRPVSEKSFVEEIIKVSNANFRTTSYIVNSITEW